MLNNGSPGDLIAANLEARDSQPVAHIPNNDQGWGRLCLNNILQQSPASDRGPGIYSDQRHAFTVDQPPQELLIKVAPVDTARPLRITLAWTDAVGSVGSSTNRARLNDLDLEVREVNTARIFKGNVFQSGFSVTGGSFDSLNNVECVYIQQPLGIYEVRVIAASLLASANPAITSDWQDFALVIDNADVPDAAPVNVATVLDRSGSMMFFGYVDITRICTRQFIDLMGVADHVGLVSFGDDARVEFPPAGTAVEEITGQPVKDTRDGRSDQRSVWRLHRDGRRHRIGGSAPERGAVTACHRAVLGWLRQQGLCSCRLDAPVSAPGGAGTACRCASVHLRDGTSVRSAVARIARGRDRRWPLLLHAGNRRAVRGATTTFADR